MTIQVDRTPYKVEYYKDGKKEVLRRTPPPLLHNGDPEDIVTIKNKRNQDWDEGDDVQIKAINPKQPNTLQVTKDGEHYTFLSSLDVIFPDKDEDEGNASEDRTAKRRDIYGSNYLLWP